ncbi:ATP-dependent zinc protease family protein [Jiulongibacter sp. NS-SX5]|uniref:ATP-dependent zinc protease family protein n=1 Tax=Jiulongibacter sp. NS-SX5 TaxID=3463854 RepID=UPI00405A3F64
MTKENLKIIGRHEKAILPDLFSYPIDVKIDTGAYTSSLHCLSIDENKGSITCEFVNELDGEVLKKKVIFADFKKRKVKSSNGTAEERFSVKTNIKIGKNSYPIEVTLTNRSQMKYPMLLGRKFLKNRFIVDVSKKYSLPIQSSKTN